MRQFIISALLSAITALTPMAETSAGEFIFRHKYPVSNADVTPPLAQVELGNDVVARYTALVDRDFTRRIPVKTTDVAEWRVVEGDTVYGIGLDDRAGVYSGKPTAVGSSMQRLEGFDAGGNLIAKAEIHLDAVLPQGVEVPVSFLAHTGHYFYGIVPTPDDIELSFWDAQYMQPVPGLAVRNEALDGVPTRPDVYTVFLQGYDHVGRPVAYAYGDLTVTDGPEIANYLDQRTDPAKNQAYSRGPAVVDHAIGTLSFQLVSLDGPRPDGMTFNSLTGHIGGVVKEFSYSGRYQVKVTDSADGTSDTTKPFTLSTVDAYYGMHDIANQVFEKGVAKSFSVRPDTNLSALDWTRAPASGALPPGLDVITSGRNGVVGYEATEVGDWNNVILRVTGPDNLDKTTNAFSIKVREKALRLQPTELHVRVNKPFETEAVGFLQGKADPVQFSLYDPQMPAGLSLDTATSKVSAPAGMTGPGWFTVRLNVVNGDGQEGIGYHRITVYPEQELSYPADAKVTRWDYGSAVIPTYSREAVIGTASFSISPDLPEGLVFNTRTGRIGLEYPNKLPKSAVGTLGPFTVTYTDDEKVPVTSQAFNIEVSNGEAFKLAATDQVADNAVTVERYLSYNLYRPIRPAKAENGRLGVTFSLDPASVQLPDGLRLLSTGIIIGSTSVAVGEYPGIVINAVDGEGSSKTFGPFSIKVVPDTQLADLTGGGSKELLWAEDRQIKPLPLARPTNGKGSLVYTLKSAPDGLSIVNGELVGTVADPGDYTVTYEISDDTAREPLTATVKLEILEKMEIDESNLPWEAHKYQEAWFAPVVKRGIQPLEFSIQSLASLPQDWRFHKNLGGAIGGAVTASSGVFPVVITVKDAAGETDTLTTDVTFLPPLDITAAWKPPTLLVGSDEGLPVDAELSDKIEIANWALSGTLPDGIGFDGTTGSFYGNPYPSADASGIHTLTVTPVPSDPEVKLTQAGGFPVTLKIGYAGEIDFPSVSFRHRVNKDIAQKLSYTKAVEPVKFTEVSVGDGVSFDAATATFTANFAEPGTYTAGSIKIEENDDPAFDREKTTGFNFEIVPDVALTVPEAMTFGQFDGKSVAITEVLNVIGDGDETTPDVTYALAEGQTLPQGLSVNALTGAVEGTPDVFGDFGPFNITASDAYGDSADSNAFALKIAERKQLEVSYPSGFGHFRRYGVHTSAPQPVNGYGPYSWSIDRDPPAGITFDRATGIFRASSDELVEPQTFTVTVVDSKGGAKGTATADVTVGISERPQLTVKYDNPVTFTRHVADMGKDPQKAGTVQRGGALEFTVEALNGGEALASCIGFDGTTGRFSTDPACTAEVPAGDYRVTVTDATWRDDGNAQGRTTADLRIGVQARPQITLKYEEYDAAKPGFGFQRHNVRTVYPTWNNPLGKDVTWSIAPTPPAGIAFNDDGSITVDTADLIADAPYVVTVEDEFDGKATFPMVLGVGEREQLKFTLDPSVPQEIALNGEYELTLDVENVIADGDDTTADVIYTLLSGTLPAGIEFDTDGNGACGVAGTFCGTADVADHGKSFTVTVRAMDNFNGRVDGTFTFGIVEDATPMTVTYAEPGKARVGYAWSLAAPEVKFAVGNYRFEAPALAQYGLSINAKTGEITGTPNTTFDLVFDVTVTDKLGAARAVTVQVPVVSVPTPTITVPNPVSILYNRDIPEDQQLTASGVEAPGVWSVDPAGLPPGLTFDPATGLFGGQAEDIGVYGPYTLTLDDALPGNGFPTVFSFDIAMNDDPIELEELSVLTKVGFPFTTKAPDYDNHYRTVRFAGPELTALGLSVDPDTGVVSGKIDDPMDVKPNLVIRDATIRTTSMPVNINVLPRLRLTAPETVTLTALDPIIDPVKVTPAFKAGELTWQWLDPALLPEGVEFDQATGTFTGTPTKVQTVGPVAVKATDTFGNGQTDTGTSNGITFVVRKGAFYMEFTAGDLPQATKRTPYSFDLIANGLFTYEGMDLSEIVWGMEDPTGTMTPAELAAKTGLSVVDGRIVGTPADEGRFDVVITAKFANRAPVKGAYLLDMKLPDTEFGLSAAAAIPDGKKGDPYSFDFKSYLTPLKNVPADKVTWTFALTEVVTDESGNVSETPVDAIKDLSLASTGAASSVGVGTAGHFKITATATFKDRTENLSATATYALTLESNDVLYASISAMFGTTCAVSDDGHAFCWGDNRLGQVGDGGNTLSEPVTSPSKVVARAGKTGDLSDVTSIVTSSASSTVCAFSGGETVCWGDTTGEQIARQAANSVSRPRLRGTGSTSAGVGSAHMCLVNSGSVVCAGQNTEYATASGLVGSSPSLLGTTHGKADRVFVGGRNVCSIEAGVLECTGRNASYNLGRGGTSTSAQVSPAPVTGLAANEVADLSIAIDHMCALTTSGAVKCWGSNVNWRLGASAGNGSTPVTPIQTGAVKVSAGATHTCALKTDGTIWCWGDNSSGQLGPGGAAAAPRQVSGLPVMKDVSAGAAHTCGLDTTGVAWCWGRNDRGQLGNESTVSSAVPAKVVSPL